MKRYFLLAIVVVIVFGAMHVGSKDARAADRLSAGAIQAALEASDQEDQGFIELVVNLTNRGLLPRSVVEGSFDWAMQKEAYKYQYFRRAVTILARRRGLKL